MFPSDFDRGFAGDSNSLGQLQLQFDDCFLKCDGDFMGSNPAVKLVVPTQKGQECVGEGDA